MNYVTHEEKDALTKTLAIVGFLVLVIFGVWLAVKIVSFVPSAFSSLASLADSVYNHNKTQEIVIEGENTVYNTGEAFTLTWGEMRKAGTYTFSYACTEGVSIDARSSAGEIIAVPCGEPLELDGATSVELLASSEKNRFTDIPYTIAYTKDGSDSVTTAVTRDLTVVNVTIPVGGTLATAPTPPENMTDAGGEKNEVNEEQPTTPAVAPVSKPKPTYVPPKTVSQTVYTLPVSNPNGTIDLQVTLLGVGTLTGSTFLKATTIDSDKQGAVQFEVKNIGTKTADSWSYKAELPADITHTSGSQKALKPNERAVITLGFDGLKADTEKVRIEVTAKGDTKNTNNAVGTSVKIVD